MTAKIRTPWHWLPLEARAIPEYVIGAWLTRSPELERGDGHRVIVIPGFGANDRATAPLRKALSEAGYQCRGWELGRNMGMSKEVGQQFAAGVQQDYESSGATVSLIGWSLGGVFARELARRHPEWIRQVITLGSPIQDADHTTIDALFRLRNPGTPRTVDPEVMAKRREPPPVPCSAIYTRSDGVVPWKAAMEPERPHTRNVVVSGSHMGLPANPQVWQECARLLAHPKAMRRKVSKPRRKVS